MHDSKIIFFTGAGMSAESGVPTYRGKGGIWNKYRWEEYACQEAFENNPQKVLDFHELRRIEAIKCSPHSGHKIIKNIQDKYPNTYIVTQNIDGMHQRIGSSNIIELHGSIWRLRCEEEKIEFEDIKDAKYSSRFCGCGNVLRPDIIWFQDSLKYNIVNRVSKLISECDFFISIGTSGMVWPAAGLPGVAKSAGAFCIEINPENSEISHIYDKTIRMEASIGLDYLYNKLWQELC